MNIYEDIAKRTNGEIYIGVVGPVRSGKSTLLLMYKEYIIPNNEKGRKLLAELKKQNKTIIISRKINLYKVKIKVDNTK